MKLLHLSDLHLGKRVNEFSMLEDQEYILTKIINIIDEEKPEGILIAGDIYDKTIPSVEAVQLFDNFLTRIANRDIKICVSSGNHDSAERIAFGAQLMNSRGVHMSPVFRGDIEPIVLSDEFGEANIYMLPFVKPAHVRHVFPDASIESYDDAVKVVVSDMNMDPSKRNVLVAHQFITGAERSESEDISIGGLDNIDASAFFDFDYVALGHIHKPQTVGKENIRYCGTPLKYSFSEANHKKSVTVVELNEKGALCVRLLPLFPKRDMREIKGTYAEITARDNYKDTDTNDYMHITLTDEDDIPDAIGKLRSIYPNIMKIDYDNNRTRSNQSVNGADRVDEKTPLELFEEFYLLQNNVEMNEEQRTFSAELIEKIWGTQK